jgi:hypothetical protein
MAQIITTPRREIDWSKLGQYAAQPFAARSEIYNQLMPLIYKAQLEKQAKIQELQQIPEIIKQIGGGTTGGFTPKSFNIGGITLERQPTQEEIQRDIERKVQETTALGIAKTKIPTTSQRDLAQKAKSQLANIEILHTQAKSLRGSYGGIKDIITSVVTRGAKSGATMQYMKKIPAYSAGIYRDLTGDNRLSDTDAQKRAEPLLWNPTISTSLRDPMFNDLKKAYQARINLLEKGEYTVDSQTGDIITPLNSVLSEAGISLTPKNGTTKSGLKYTIEG